MRLEYMRLQWTPSSFYHKGNYVIRRDISARDNSSTWHLNGKSSNEKDVSD